MIKDVKKRRVIFITLILQVIFFLSVISGYAQAIECSTNSPNINVSYSTERPEFDRTLDFKVLTQMHSPGANDHINAQEPNSLGLMKGEVRARVDIAYTASTINQKAYCMVVKDIKVSLLSVPKIYIARNFPRGSCEYNAILKHEEEHVEITKQTLKDHVKKYKKYIKERIKAFSKSEQIQITNINQQKEKMTGEIQALIFEYMPILYEDLAKRQAAIDTPEEYGKIQESCRKWDKRMER